ncbi:Basic-leucine zipper domain [Dillenia turbinata]|uniref:Basic-leucine zipper domain n=1 Tax=Dillenia turbinata TaxID=194707 RepID=A0AAN8ZNL7_9MAGN
MISAAHRKRRPSSTSSPTSDEFSGEFRKEDMARNEIEAAEVLADMAARRERDSTSSNGGTEWGNKGKRAGKQRGVNGESTPSDSKRNLDDYQQQQQQEATSNLLEEQLVMDEAQNRCGNTTVGTENDEQEEGSTDMKACYDQNYKPFHVRKSRRNLTEADKEARRLRRVLANRESARQTIRRRQALCEDLNRKAADLAWENINLKKERDFAMKEYQSLQSANKHLKEQVANMLKVEAKETPEESYAAHVNTSTTLPTNRSVLLYNQPPFTSFLWPPPMLQSSNPFQTRCGPQNTNTVSAKDIAPTAGMPTSSHVQENPSINGTGTPFYVVPCPLFFPLPGHVGGVHPQPSSSMGDKQDETSADNHQSSLADEREQMVVGTSQLPMKRHLGQPDSESQHSSLSIKFKNEFPGFAEVKPAMNYYEAQSRFSVEENDQPSQPKELDLMPAALNFVSMAVSNKHEDGLRVQKSLTTKVSTTNCHVLRTMPEKNHALTIQSTKKSDAVTAAEARRRRKELTKLKNIHGRPFHTYY